MDVNDGAGRRHAAAGIAVSALRRSCSCPRPAMTSPLLGELEPKGLGPAAGELPSERPPLSRLCMVSGPPDTCMPREALLSLACSTASLGL